MGQTFELEPATNGARRESVSSSEEHRIVVAYQDELDEARALVAKFPDLDPDVVLMAISGIAGRVAEIRAQLFRLNGQRFNNLRTREVDPLREDLELQFKLHSRRIALMEFELKMSGGAI